MKSFKHRNKLLAAVTLAMVLLLVFSLTACNFVLYTLYFDPNYEGAEVIKKNYSIGEKAELPVVTRNGYKFEGWFADGDDSPVTEIGMLSSILGDTVYYAKWTVLPQSLQVTVDGQFFVGDSVSPEQLTVVVNYFDGTTKETTSFKMDNTALELLGANAISVSYTENGCTVYGSAIINTEMVVPQSISAIYRGGRVSVGDEIDISNFSASVTYNNGVQIPLENFDISGFSSETAGEKVVTVSYTEGKTTVTTTVIVLVGGDDVELVEISASYVGENILVGEQLCVDDILVAATYSDDSACLVFNFNVGAFSSAEAGVQTVDISYTEKGITKSTTITITVVSDDVVARGNLSIHFLELGNQYTGDCVYIKAGDTDVLIDAGSRENSASTITKYVDKYCTDGILEYVVVTHAHKDHIAGFVGSNSAEGIFKHYEVENIIQFAQTGASTVVYKNYCAARDAEVAEGANLYTAKDCILNENGAEKVYNLTDDGTIQMEILDQKYYYSKSSNENNNSVCLMINQGENHYLFTGDLEDDGEISLVDKNPDLPEMVLYKGGHHGSYTAASTTLLSKIKPQYVCICTCAGTTEYTTGSHSFPAQEFIDRVAPYTDQVYITTLADNYPQYQSMNGNIVFSCNNGVISLNCSNNNIKLKDTDWFKNNRTCPAAWK